MNQLSLAAMRADTILSAEETGEVLGIVGSTVRRFARQGKIKAFRAGNSYKFRWSDVRDFIERNDASASHK